MTNANNYHPDEGSQYVYDAQLEAQEAWSVSIKESAQLVVNRMSECGFFPSDKDSVAALEEWIGELFDRGNV